MTFGEQLSRRTFRSQNKYFTCVKIPKASSFLRRKLSSLPGLHSTNTVSEYIIKPDTRSCAFYRLRFYQVFNGRGIYLSSTAINFLIKLHASELQAHFSQRNGAMGNWFLSSRRSHFFFPQARCVSSFIVTPGCRRRGAAFLPLACLPQDKIHRRSLIANETTIKRCTSGLDVAEFSCGLLAWINCDSPPS